MANRIFAVIGLGFGDEGKGMVTDTLAAHFNRPMVIRYSGGQQAGHTVDHGDIKHTFANFGSGTLSGVPTYWSKYCTVDPIGIMNEYYTLIEKMGNDHGIKLYIDERCPVTTPFEVHKNQTKDHLMNGSCGVGVGLTHQREEDHYHLRFSDLFYPTILNIKLSILTEYYGTFAVDLNKFREAIKDIESMLGVEIIKVPRMPKAATLIYEGSQGLLLDPEIGFFPHVTRSSVGSKNIWKEESINEIYYVTRAYQTRHGVGPMTNMQHGILLKNIENETNVTNEFQGKFFKSLLDLDLLEYALKEDRRHRRSATGSENLVITCMDQLDEYQFTYGKKVHKFKNEGVFIASISAILGFGKNVYLSRSSRSNFTKWEGGK